MNESQKELVALSDDFWELMMRSNPTMATYIGDHRYDDRLPDISDEQRKHEHDEVEGFKTRLNKIDTGQLTEQERISCEILKLDFDFALEAELYKSHEWSIDQMSGPQVWLFELINYHPLKTEKNYRDLIARFWSFPKYLDQHLQNLQVGMREGRIAPKVAVIRVVSQLKEILNTSPDKSPITVAIDKIPTSFSKELKRELRGLILKAIKERIYPSFEKFLNYLEDGYIARAREDVGIWAIKDGNANYDFLMRMYTTTELSAEEIHKIGLQELKSIQNEMQAIAKRLGHTGDLKSFFEKLKADKSNFPTSREAILGIYNAILKKVQSKLPAYFGMLPKAKCEVKAIEDYREKDSPVAFYYPPPDDFSRPGIFYADTYKPETRPRYNMTALTAHEAVPGHHLQIALNLELENLPQFRKHASFTSFVEGWALYTERLADEMGMYEDDLSRFGMLTYQAWRACRLVVDSGMHHMRWSRQKAIDFLRESTAITDEEIFNEIDRYIVIPGQALAYMIGKREIFTLRSEAQKGLGGSFDIREFHDEVLKNGALPLSILRRNIEKWISSKKDKNKMHFFLDKTALFCIFTSV